MSDTIAPANTRPAPLPASVVLFAFMLSFLWLHPQTGRAAAGDSPAITFTVSINGPFKFVHWQSAAPAGANTRICFIIGFRRLYCEDVNEGSTSGTVRTVIGIPIEDCTAEFVSE